MLLHGLVTVDGKVTRSRAATVAILPRRMTAPQKWLSRRAPGDGPRGFAR